MKSLGERIRELREERDLSLRELATTISVSAAFLSDVELGRRYPSDKHLEAIARALETTMNDLGQYDTRPPVQEFRRRTLSDPELGFAFRQVMNRKVSSKELLDFLKGRDAERGGKPASEDAE
jgi:transcriptional regulator with XRE-family HTH domain